jgi:hypothetical protein
MQELKAQVLTMRVQMMGMHSPVVDAERGSTSSRPRIRLPVDSSTLWTLSVHIARRRNYDLLSQGACRDRITHILYDFVPPAIQLHEKREGDPTRPCGITEVGVRLALNPLTTGVDAMSR